MSAEFTILDPLEIFLLITTLLISTSSSVVRIIQNYQVQSYLLAFITGGTVFIAFMEEPRLDTFFLIFVIMILPIGLALLINFILARATLGSVQHRFSLSAIERQEAHYIWRRNETTTSIRIREAMVFGSLVTLAFLVAFQFDIDTFQTTQRIGLMVSLTLYLVGLYNMIIKRDIISQVIGLLIMDHGLYLAVVKIVAIPTPAYYFVLGLVFYTLITLTILIVVMPELRRRTNSINLDEIMEKSNLEG